MQKGNSTTNAILVILVVVLVAFGAWYITSHRTPSEPVETSDSTLEINLGDTNGGTSSQ